MLVKFKKKREQGGVEKPRPAMPSRAPDWDPNDVETPEPKRRLKSFDKKQDYVAIVEYRRNAKSGGPTIQRLGFKAEGGFLNASQAAYKIAAMVGKAVATDLHEIRNEQMCRVIAVYEVNSFKDWEKENRVSDKAKNSHVHKAIKAVKNDRVNPISYAEVTNIKTR